MRSMVEWDAPLLAAQAGIVRPMDLRTQRATIGDQRASEGVRSSG